jgi:hypothetical protein
LIPRKPLSTSALYTIQNAHPRANHTLTDLQGIAVHGNVNPAGTFSFNLEGNRSLSWAAPGPPTISNGTDQGVRSSVQQVVSDRLGAGPSLTRLVRKLALLATLRKTRS